MLEAVEILLSVVVIAGAVWAIVAVNLWSHSFWRRVFRGLRENMRHGDPKL